MTELIGEVREPAVGAVMMCISMLHRVVCIKSHLRFKFSKGVVCRRL